MIIGYLTEEDPKTAVIARQVCSKFLNMICLQNTNISSHFPTAYP